MAKNRYDSLKIVEQIYAYVEWHEFTKLDVPMELRNYLGSLSTSGYIKKVRKIRGEHNHLIPVYCISSRYHPSSRVPPLSSTTTNTQISNESDTV